MKTIFPMLRIATRNSPLALWQANYVRAALLVLNPDLQIQIQGFLTQGDKLLTASLAKTGGKGLFVKELETALLEGKADIAVHSIKDMVVQQTPGLKLAVVCERDDPRDAFVSNRFDSLLTLPPAAIVGTSSSRRACLLQDLRPDLKIAPLRGNVGTRLKKLDEGQYDAIILAAAGLKRLGEVARIRAYLEVDTWVPAVGQGAIGIECRENDEPLLAFLAPLTHQLTQSCIAAERAFNAALNGGCQLPIAAHAICANNQLTMQGFVGHLQKNESLRATLTGPMADPAALGKALAELLLQKGAENFLAIMHE